MVAGFEDTVCSVCSPTNTTSSFYTDDDGTTWASTQSYVCHRCQRVLEDLPKPVKASYKIHYKRYDPVKHHIRSVKGFKNIAIPKPRSNL